MTEGTGTEADPPAFSTCPGREYRGRGRGPAHPRFREGSGPAPRPRRNIPRMRPARPKEAPVTSVMRTDEPAHCPNRRRDPKIES
ncbi:hypothetical protein GCM10017778_27580 [Streptomyces vinaceus]|nr:hypothetical protein GCM10017778_27580 [Streptomyces vinaceus]